MIDVFVLLVFEALSGIVQPIEALRRRMHHKGFLIVRSCLYISIFVLFWPLDSGHAWRRLLMVMLLLSFVLLFVRLGIEFTLRPHFVSKVLFFKDMVVGSHH